MRRGPLPPRTEQASRWLVWGVLLASLAACHEPPPPAPVVLAPPPSVIEPAKPPEPVNASWSFSITQSACVARAANHGVSFTLSFGSSSKLEFALSAPALHSRATRAGARGRLQFRGGTGSWTWAARVTSQRTLAGLLPANKIAADDVLIALEGGVLRTELVHSQVPALRIPAANVAGREWFDCVREKIARADS